MQVIVINSRDVGIGHDYEWQVAEALNSMRQSGWQQS